MDRRPRPHGSDLDRGASLDRLFAQRSNLLRPGFWTMIRDILRFWRDARALLARPDPKLTLGSFLDGRDYSRQFIEHHLLPMGASIWSLDARQMRQFPAVAFAGFLENHGLLQLRDRPVWRAIRGGSARYVERLVAPFRDQIHLQTPRAIVIAEQFYESARRSVDFIKRYVFPGGHLPSVGAIASSVARATDLRFAHLEDLTPHYAETLRRWCEGFLANHDDLRALGYDEPLLRLWEFYLRYCEGGFEARHIGLLQLVLDKPACRMTVPVSRSVADLPVASA